MSIEKNYLTKKLFDLIPGDQITTILKSSNSKAGVYIRLYGVMDDTNTTRVFVITLEQNEEYEIIVFDCTVTSIKNATDYFNLLSKKYLPVE